ncbi:uncharacterized protein LOC107268653 [Cephus cinctus]|uniref:Uncharacterized protein LOC107268653 n=1 Tax=Cephus cinctus TaxID=211228 RepID=A0AAJ7RKB3_CEPCN|nr:uncharacterized protein LOC107268653 [Cephus cinctus]
MGYLSYSVGKKNVLCYSYIFTDAFMAITSDVSNDDDDQDDVDDRSTASNDSNEHNPDSLDTAIANDSREPIVQGDLLPLQDQDNAEEPILWVLRNGVYVEADADKAAEVLADLDDDDDDENPNDADTYEAGGDENQLDALFSYIGDMVDAHTGRQLAHRCMMSSPTPGASNVTDKS